MRALKIILIVWAMLGAFVAAASGDPPRREYEVKAAMICTIAQFVEWPPGSFDSDASPVVIEVVGENPFGQALEQIAASKKVGDRSIVVKYVENADQIGTCHLLFVPASDTSHLGDILQAVR